MAIRTDFAPGEVLAAGDLNDTFGAKLNLAGGKILQVVRATDTTSRTTTSTSFVDVTGMSVTITPQKADSNIIIIGLVNGQGRSFNSNSNQQFRIILTNSSNTELSGANDNRLGQFGTTSDTSDTGLGMTVTLFGFVAAGSTAAQTFKMRFAVSAATTTCTIANATQTGQLYAIEVSA